MKTKIGGGAAGFSVAEVLMAVALAAAVLLIGVPALFQFINRSRLEGVTRETSMLLHRARMESIRRGVPVVVFPDFDADRVTAYADVVDSGGAPVSNLQYDPGVESGRSAEDYEIGRVMLAPQRVFFWGAADSPGGPDADPEGGNAVKGFTDLPGLAPNGAVFDPDGSVRDLGAFRFGDANGNLFEVLVSPASTARVQVRKYNPDLPALDGTTYFAQGRHPGTGERTWVWY